MPANTKSYRCPVEESDGERCLISRYWARGRKRMKLHIVAWIRDLRPRRTAHGISIIKIRARKEYLKKNTQKGTVKK
jgi:uncharacterized protein YeaO (DUF488 family)